MVSAAAEARFISFEGVDGSGKSTQAHRCAEALRAAGATVLETREPGGTGLGEAVRRILLDPDPEVDVSDAAEVLLFAASRAQLVRQVVRPALESGTWVVCDRFLDSSLAYQGVGRGVGIDRVLAANAPAVDGCLPWRTFVIEVDPAEARRRRTGGDDRIEAEDGAFHERVAAGYRELAERFPERLVIVDGDGDVEAVHDRVWRSVTGGQG